jgi:ribosome maturation factor RimP
MESLERLTALVEKELDDLGFELVKLDMASLGRRTVLRVFIDDPETGVTLEDCVKATRVLGLALEGDEIMPGPYNLEVSSPGINRALSKPEHFIRFTGKEVKIEYSGEGGEKRTAIGIISAADGAAVTISSGSEELRIGMSRILRANLHGEKWEISKRENRKKD